MFPVGDSEIFWNLYEVFVFVLHIILQYRITYGEGYIMGSRVDFRILQYLIAYDEIYTIMYRVAVMVL